MDWYRAYHGMCTDPKLHKASRMAKVHRSVAIAAWVSVLEVASQEEDRGRVNGLDASDLAFMIDESQAVAIRVLDAFRALGMIADGRVVAWSKRQFASDDVLTRVKKHREKNAKPLKTNETTPTGNVSETPQNRTDSEEERKKESYAADLQTQPPPAEQQRQETVSSATLELVQKRLEGFGMSLALLERRVAAMVADRGSAAAVENALLQALAQARGDPLAYAQKMLTNRATERIAAVVAAKATALAPAEDPNLQAHRMTLEAIARMRANGEEFAGAYHGTPDQPAFSPWPAIQAEPGTDTLAEWPVH